MSELSDLIAERTEVKAAITAILSGAQSYTVNGQTVTRASLDSLYKRLDNLDSRIACKQNGGGGFRKRPVFGA